MEQCFYVEAATYVIAILFLNLTSNFSRRAFIITWRVVSFLTIVDLMISIHFNLSMQNCIFVILLLVHCFILIPLQSPNSTCMHCGRRVFWRPLISRKCLYCQSDFW